MIIIPSLNDVLNWIFFCSLNSSIQLTKQNEKKKKRKDFLANEWNGCQEKLKRNFQFESNECFERIMDSFEWNFFPEKLFSFVKRKFSEKKRFR